MVKIAVFSDIHGNLQAAEAAATEIESWGPDRLWFLGDAVVFGPDPGGCLQLLRERLVPEIAIEGNTDRYLRELRDGVAVDRPPLVSRALALCEGLIDDTGRQQLLGFQRDVQVEVEGVTFHLCHGSPEDDEYRVAVDNDAAEIERRVKATGADVVLCAHTHVPWVTDFGATRLINDGSVGYPFDGDVRGAWAALDVADGELRSVEIRRFEFDRDETIRRLEAFGEGAEVLVQRLRTARP